MGLAQEGLLALVNMDLGKVSLLVVANRVPSLDMDNRVLVMVSHPAMVHTTQGQVSLLARVQVDLGQDSLVVLGNMVLHRETLLALVGKDLDKVTLLVGHSVAQIQDSHQAMAQVSPLSLASMDQLHVIHRAKKGTGLAQGSLVAPNNLGLAQEGLLALINMHLGKVSLLVVANRVPSLDSHEVVISTALPVVIPLAMVSMALALVSLPAVGLTRQVQVSLLDRAEVALGQDSLHI